MRCRQAALRELFMCNGLADDDADDNFEKNKDKRICLFFGYVDEYSLLIRARHIHDEFASRCTCTRPES